MEHVELSVLAQLDQPTGTLKDAVLIEQATIKTFIPLEVYLIIFEILKADEDKATSVCLGLTSTTHWGIHKKLNPGITKLIEQAIHHMFIKVNDKFTTRSSTSYLADNLESWFGPQYRKFDLSASWEQYKFQESTRPKARYFDILVYDWMNGSVNFRNHYSAWHVEVARDFRYLNCDVYGERSGETVKENELVGRYWDYHAFRTTRDEFVFPNPYNMGDEWYPETVKALDDFLDEWEAYCGQTSVENWVLNSYIFRRTELGRWLQSQRGKM